MLCEYLCIALSSHDTDKKNGFANVECCRLVSLVIILHMGTDVVHLTCDWCGFQDIWQVFDSQCSELNTILIFHTSRLWTAVGSGHGHHTVQMAQYFPVINWTTFKSTAGWKSMSPDTMVCLSNQYNLFVSLIDAFYRSPEMFLGWTCYWARLVSFIPSKNVSVRPACVFSVSRCLLSARRSDRRPEQLLGAVGSGKVMPSGGSSGCFIISGVADPRGWGKPALGAQCSALAGL
jgi:hypothetical protein